MKRVLTIIGSAAVVLVVLSLVWSFPTANPVAAREGSGSADAGKQVFLDQKCDLCHDVSTAGITAKTKSAAMKGPDLVNIATDEAAIAAYLKQESEMNGKKHKKAIKGSDDEIASVVAFIKAQTK
ncbi:MAG: cytochrome c [Acidobacteriota bacterium]|nr:MAG: cytochrome c [Acidobacteriota bacterium]